MLTGKCSPAGSLDGLDGAQLGGKAEEEKAKHCWPKIFPRTKHWPKIFPRRRRGKLPTEGRGAKNDGWDMVSRARQLSPCNQLM